MPSIGLASVSGAPRSHNALASPVLHGTDQHTYSWKTDTSHASWILSGYFQGTVAPDRGILEVAMKASGSSPRIQGFVGRGPPDLTPTDASSSMPGISQPNSGQGGKQQRVVLCRGLDAIDGWGSAPRSLTSDVSPRRIGGKIS